MKKFFVLVLTLVMLVSSLAVVSEARVGDVIGSALHTDIVVYINNYSIPSYAVNGQSVVVAEDLRNFGFDVVWNEYARSLSISRNSDYNVYPMHVDKSHGVGEWYTSILATDISVWAGDRRLTSYAMNGYTMIPAEELTMFGSVTWVPEERALKIWVDNLDSLSSNQVVSRRYYTGSYTPDFGWVTQSLCVEWDDDAYGNKSRYYYAEDAQIKQYINYITQHGWTFDKSEQGSDGIWYSAYINKALRTGVVISGWDGIAFIQVGVDIDYWDLSDIK